MILPFELFEQKIESIGEILPGAPISAEGVAVYYEAVQHITPERFAEVCSKAIEELEFFPKPKWVRERAIELSNSEAQKQPALPYAEPVGGGTCPPHVRKWMQMRSPTIAENRRRLRAVTKAASYKAIEAHAAKTGRRVPASNPVIIAVVEKDPEVIDAKKALEIMPLAEALAEMQMLKESMTEEEIIEYSYEFSFEEDVGEIAAMPAEPVTVAVSAEDDW